MSLPTAIRDNQAKRGCAGDFLKDATESYLRSRMAERDLLSRQVESQGPPGAPSKRWQAAPAKLNAPFHPIRNRLLRLAADSSDLLAILKQEGRVK